MFPILSLSQNEALEGGGPPGSSSYNPCYLEGDSLAIIWECRINRLCS